MMKKRLIVVDDDLTFGNLVSEIAKITGFDVSVMTSVKEFNQDINENQHFDAMTIDISMPGTDGYEFIDQLAKLQCNAAIILISGQDLALLRGAEKMAKIKGLNLLATLRKPFDVEEFENLLTQV